MPRPRATFSNKLRLCHACYRPLPASEKSMDLGDPPVAPSYCAACEAHGSARRHRVYLAGLQAKA